MPDVPPQLAAAFLPRYCIQRELGVGGMATVFLARDVRHERDVAIKILNRDLADVVGADRFIAEIRTTAHLRHPHILPLFDSGAADGLPFYVMPFVDGESLRSRLRAQGRLPLADAVRSLREVADALAHAHALGIVHRDVKPDNVLMSGRHAFLADFGVARAVAAHVGQDQTVTGTGVMIGTPAYMAPEQITGGAVDRRSDIYAFGVTAYELLAGVPPFRGARQDVISAQLTAPPASVTDLRSDTPAPLAKAIMQCLHKKPDHRWQRIEDLLPVLDLTTAAETGASPLRSSAGARRSLWALAAGGVIVAGMATGYYALHRSAVTPTALVVGKMTRITSEAGLELDPAISPDGRAIAYAAGLPGHTRIYVRQILGGRMVPLTDDDAGGTQRWPQWSPDGRQILFQTGRPHFSTRSLEGRSELFAVPALGGVARRVPGEFPRSVAISPSWSRDGRRIAFAGPDGIYTIDAENASPATLLAPGLEVTSPAWSPDGHRIAFVSRGIFFTFGEETFGNVSTSTIFVVDVDSRKQTQITTGNWLDVNPVWMPDGRSLLFISSRGGGRDVFRQRFDSAGQALGEPDRVTTGINAHGISLAADGRLLAYSSYVQRANIWSVPIPENRVVSVREADQVTFGTEMIEKLAISRDGRWLAYDSDRGGQPDIWKVPLAGGTPEQVTHGPNNKFVNDWSPDGQEIAYHSMREGGQRDVMVVSADGVKTEVVANSPAEEQHSGWGPDGNSIIYDLAKTTDLQNQIYLVRRARRGAAWGTPKRLTSSGSSDPKWSPDGRFIAYCVGGELRLIAPDGTGQHVVVSQVPGRPRPSYPIWSTDSRTIYYKAYDAELQTSIWSVSVDGGQPRLLVTFDDPTRRSLRREFATDGKRFYFTVASDESDLWAMELSSK